jgi:hypothetical protein
MTNFVIASEAKQSRGRASGLSLALDCFVAALLAMKMKSTSTHQALIFDFNTQARGERP